MTDERREVQEAEARDHRAVGDDAVSRVRWGAVVGFSLLACGLAWLVALPMWLSGGPEAPNLSLLISATGAIMMFTPAVAALITMFAWRLPASDRARSLGLWPLRPTRRVVWFSVGAIFAPLAIVVLVIAVSAALGLVRLDLIEFSGARELIEAQLATLGPAAPDASSALPPIGVIVAVQVAMIPVGALVNSVFALGEELGWRGWLLPALRPLGVWPAILISGVIWGVWHAPLILVGYNFGYTDWRGVALMIGGCVAWGALLSWARLRSGSVWPAVIGHGALNASAGLVTMLVAAGAAPDMGLVGPLGMVAWLVIAVIVVVLVLTGQFSREPQLAARRDRSAEPPST